jgi:hypothetical protein
MSYMFWYFGKRSSATNLTLPAFPDGFGAAATDMIGMFMEFGQNSPLETVSISWSSTDVGSFASNVSKNAMFTNFASNTAVGDDGAKLFVKNDAAKDWLTTGSGYDEGGHLPNIVVLPPPPPRAAVLMP